MLVNYSYLYKSSVNNLNRIGEASEKSSRRLASGLKINSAADDSAGLAISERMRSMIIGLSRATNNVQDAISLIQTADGGLANVQEQLQRIRELCIQAANGTLTDYDRSLIQKEIEEIKGGVDTVANTTEFNSQKVLRPPIDVVTTTTGGKADIIFVIDRTGSMGSRIANVKSNIDAFVEKMTSAGIDVNLGIVTYGDIHSTKDPSDPDIIKYGTMTTADEFKANLDSIVLGNGGDYAESGLEGIMDSTNGALSYALRADATKQIVLVTDATVHTASGTGKSVYEISDVTDALTAQGIKFTLVSTATTAVKNQFNPLISATGGTSLNISTNFKDDLESYADDIVSDSSTVIEATEMKDFIIHVGANEGQNMTLKMMDSRIMQLGLKDLSVKTANDAENAISTVDNILEKVSTQRATLGAYQNRLEHIFNANENSEENLSASKSRIADADMAKEATNVLRCNVLQNAVQYVMSQTMQLHKGMIYDLLL